MVDKKKRSREENRRDGYVVETNLPDYGVPSGVQLTENLNEEIAEASGRDTTPKIGHEDK